MKYDPLSDVDPKAWMARDEFERIDAVEQYPRRNKVCLTDVRVRVLFHLHRREPGRSGR